MPWVASLPLRTLSDRSVSEQLWRGFGRRLAPGSLLGRRAARAADRLDDGRVGEGRRISERLPVRDVAQEPAHDLAATRLGQLGGEEDFVRPRQHIGRNRQSDLLGRLEIDHQLELRGLLYRQIGRLISRDPIRFIPSS